MHDARGEALRRGAASRRAAAASSAESTMRCIHRASRRQRDAQPQLGRRSVRVEGPSDTKHQAKIFPCSEEAQTGNLVSDISSLEKQHVIRKLRPGSAARARWQPQAINFCMRKQSKPFFLEVDAWSHDGRISASQSTTRLSRRARPADGGAGSSCDVTTLVEPWEIV